jgi:hypothetical protein
MKILILRSIPNSIPAKDDYGISMDVHYADRVIGHLSDKGEYCKACQDDCISCRKGYKLDFSDSIAGILEFPARLPAILDDPEEYLPKSLPEHEVIIAIAVNEELLLALAERLNSTRGLIVPQEGSNWITPNYIQKISALCRENGIESAFPKPFCSFQASEGILAEFMKEFRIGRPRVSYKLKDGKIIKARVEVSAPCGATYYTCRGLTGRGIDEDLKFIIDNRLSAYPCTADHAVDREFNDSITHQAVKIQREILESLRTN